MPRFLVVSYKRVHTFVTLNFMFVFFQSIIKFTTDVFFFKEIERKISIFIKTIIERLRKKNSRFLGVKYKRVQTFLTLKF
jgi:hypothetical protein